MTGKGSLFIIGVLILVALVFANSVFASDKITIIGKAFTPTAFIADDGRVYFISDRSLGKELVQLRDIYASKTKVTGNVRESQGKWIIDVIEYARISKAHCYPYGC